MGKINNSMVGNRYTIILINFTKWFLECRNPKAYSSNFRKIWLYFDFPPILGVVVNLEQFNAIIQCPGPYKLISMAKRCFVSKVIKFRT